MTKTLLPNHAIATVDEGKLRNYSLSQNHPEGRHKAKVLLSALGITAADSDWLARAILATLPECEAIPLQRSAWGQIYQVDMDLTRGGRCAKVRTGWICTENTARLVTCFIVGGSDETA